jgi:outer membrane protein TolC
LEEIAPELVKRPITLDDAIALALSVNPAMATAGQALYGAHGRVNEARSSLGPTLGFSPSEDYIRRIAAPAYQIAATMPIDISHLLAAAVSQAQFQEVAARIDVNRTRNEMVYSVENTFYEVLRSQALVKVAEENLQDSLDRLHDAEARYQAQAVSYIDVVRAQTDVADSQRYLIQTQNQVSNAQANLANAIGIAPTSTFTVSDVGAVEQPPGVSPPPAKIVFPTPPTTLPGTNPASPSGSPPGAPPAPIPGVAPALPADQGPPASETSISSSARVAGQLVLGHQFELALEEALKQRPEIFEAEANLAAAKKGILIAQRSILPSLQLEVGYFDYRADTGTQINEPQAFLGLSIPFYDSGLSRARMEEARATVSNATTSIRQQIDIVTLDVQRAYLALVQTRDQVAVANQGLVQARAAFEIALVRYNAGVSSRAGISPLLEVSDAQAALTLAEQNQVNSVYDYNNARASLDRSIGRFAYTNMGEGYPTEPSNKEVGR